MFSCPTCHESLWVANWSCPDHTAGSGAFSEAVVDSDPVVKPVPLFGSYDEMTGPRSGLRLDRKILLILLVLVGVPLLREFGWLNLAAAHFSSTGNAAANVSGSSSSDDGSKPQNTNQAFQSSLNFDRSGHFFDLGVNDSKSPAWLVDLQQEVQRNLAGAEEGDAVVDGVNLTGAYWVPVYKSGGCAYHARVKVLNRDHIEMNGEVQGSVELNIYPVCSVRSYTTQLAKIIASQIRDVMRGIRNKQ